MWIGSYLAKVNPATVLPWKSAALWRKPALVIQGGADTLIPMSDAKLIASAAHCPLWVVPNAKHAQCYELCQGPVISNT